MYIYMCLEIVKGRGGGVWTANPLVIIVQHDNRKHKLPQAQNIQPVRTYSRRRYVLAIYGIPVRFMAFR